MHNVGIAYKLFRVKHGQLYPPMVENRDKKDTPIGVWLEAEAADCIGVSKTGRPRVKSISGSELAFRPGFHLCEIPRAIQFDRMNKKTGEKEFPKDFVWARCEYVRDVNYQQEADDRGYERTKIDEMGNVIISRSKKYQHSLAGLTRVPVNGYYVYRTNPNPKSVSWIIAGKIRVLELMDDVAIGNVLKQHQIPIIHRQGGDKTVEELLRM